MTRFLIIAVVAALAVVPAATAKKQSSVQVKKGATTLALDPATAGALTQEGYTLAVLEPGRATEAGLRFPITPSRLSSKTLAGNVKHRGGIAISKGETTVELRNFTIDVDDAVLTAKVGDARLAILDLDLANAEITRTSRKLTVANVDANLTAGAADALNQAFATALFSGGLDVGTATVSGALKAKK